MKNQLQTFMDRPQRYQNIDGTVEMIMGLMLVGFFLAGCLEDTLPDNSPRWMHALVIYGVMIPVLGLGFWGAKAIKEYITWPRTGYVAYRREGKAWWTVLGASCLGAAALAALMVLAMRHTPSSLMRICTSAIYVAIYAVWAFRAGKEHPWKWLVLAFMALGLLGSALTVAGDYEHWARPALLFVGLVWVGSGGATLYWYLHHTQPPAEGTE